ncbi:MAG: elongation factor P [Parcubacteria group bacterium Gr01-1014_66]|nr:MAG: elongation factor P [Parcubacteria group bacterium Gr01-1014_66]
MLSYTDLKRGVQFLNKDGAPYEVIESTFTRMQQRKATVFIRARNLATGKIYDLNLQPSDTFEEAQIEKRPLLFLYSHRGENVFTHPSDRSTRVSFPDIYIESIQKWLKPNTEVIALFCEGKLLRFSLPIKMDFIVKEAAPHMTQERAQAGTKAVVLETGAVVQAPPFIHAGDIIRINTETEAYVERVEKG